MAQTVPEILRKLLSELHVTQKTLAKMMDMSPQYMSQLISGKREKVRSEYIRSLEYAMAANMYSDVPAEHLADMPGFVLVEELAKAANGAPLSNPDVIIPRYTTNVRAGTGAPIFGEEVEDFNVTEHYRGTAAYTVSGDSMIDAGIEEGDRVIVRTGAAFNHRDIILMRYNGELQIKGVTFERKQGETPQLWFHPANERYHPWPLQDDDQFECLGRVIEIISDPKPMKFREVNK